MTDTLERALATLDGRTGSSRRVVLAPGGAVVLPSTTVSEASPPVEMTVAVVSAR